MGNHFSHLVRRWRGQSDQCRWVLGTVYATEGPSYRKAGAMMLFNDQGQQFGLLSGGCLEADINRHARMVMDSGRAMTLCYDGSDEDDMSFQLGIGCGGLVRILLQPVTAANDYLALPAVFCAIEERSAGFYRQLIVDGGEPRAEFLPAAVSRPLSQRGQLVEDERGLWLETPLQPAPHLLVVGGGIDARPLVAMASQLGWEVTLCDPRPANARREYFATADTILRCQPSALAEEALFPHFDAAVVMTHNLKLDAQAIGALQGSPLSYLALIGPLRRKHEVLALAGLAEDQLAIAVHGPAGLDLGAELPEGVALSILAECHGVLTGTSVQSLSDPLRAQLPVSRRMS